jgi:hypothetical protein
MATRSSGGKGADRDRAAFNPVLSGGSHSAVGVAKAAAHAAAIDSDATTAKPLTLGDGGAGGGGVGADAAGRLGSKAPPKQQRATTVAPPAAPPSSPLTSRSAACSTPPMPAWASLPREYRGCQLQWDAPVEATRAPAVWFLCAEGAVGRGCANDCVAPPAGSRAPRRLA